MIEKVCPATVKVPVRAAVPGLAATEYPTDPLPLPAPPEVIEIQASLLEAVHEQPAVAVTETVPVPDDAKKDWLADEREYEQDTPL